MARAPRDQLDGQRRLPPAPQRQGAAPQPHRRHHMVPRPRGGQTGGGRHHAGDRGHQPARGDDCVGNGRGRPADAMTRILDVRRYPEARDEFRWDALWDLVDGDRTRLNLAHECVDRHAGQGTALRIQFADGRREEHDFAALAEWSSRFANVLEEDGVGRGDRVAIMLEPSLELYGAVFGTVKRGAVAVPLFTLFGPEGLALRIDDCRPRMLLVE